MAIRSRPRELAPSDLAWTCDPASLGFANTGEVARCRDIIGQERAMAAFRLGLDVASAGYNIFISGLTGTGRSSSVAALLEHTIKGSRVPPDKLYVHNFKNPESPRIITLPAGAGRRFRAEMDRLVEGLQEWIPSALESEDFRRRLQRLAAEYRRREADIFRGFETEIAQEKFAVVRVQVGSVSRPEIVPVVDGKPVSVDELPALAEAGKLGREEMESFQARHDSLKDKLEAAFRQARHLGRAQQEAVRRLRAKHAAPAVREEIHQIAARYESTVLKSHLEEVLQQVLDDLDLFIPGEEPLPAAGSIEDPFRPFRVNVLVDNSELKQAPVIVETTPGFRNIFGTIERAGDPGATAPADFLDLRAGSLVRADGGYLVLNLADVGAEPGVWAHLKRALKYRQLTIQGPDALTPMAATALTPEPITVDVKVIVIGEESLYRHLLAIDHDFPKVFKVKAEFEPVAPLTARRQREYAGFVARLCDDEHLPQLGVEAMARLLEEAVRSAGWKRKISARFSDLADIVRESGLWCRRAGGDLVAREHVEQAIRAREYRLQSLADQMQEALEAGTLVVATAGAEVGTVNALAVYDLGDIAFGKPCRITAVTSAGKAGLINIEREARLSGRSHDKGVLILEGYLRQIFAGRQPMTLSASVCFEQSYMPVDGDSASSTEIYAILSSLSGLPIRQSLAVTGSLSQTGAIQTVGGVNEKIEGFFELCQARGLTGEHGVLIPQANIEHLNLRRELVEAVEQGLFHIYPVATVEQGIQLLTGQPAGRRRPDGSFPPRSVYGRAAARLAELHRAAGAERSGPRRRRSRSSL